MGICLNVCHYLSGLCLRTVNRLTFQLGYYNSLQYCPAKRQRIRGILSMIVIKFEFDKQPCILPHTCIGRPIVIKIEASRDFLGGLAAFIFTAGSRLAAVFTTWLQLCRSVTKIIVSRTTVFLHLPIQLVRMRIHKTSAFWNRMLCSVYVFHGAS